MHTQAAGDTLTASPSGCWCCATTTRRATASWWRRAHLGSLVEAGRSLEGGVLLANGGSSESGGVLEPCWRPAAGGSHWRSGVLELWSLAVGRGAVVEDRSGRDLAAAGGSRPGEAAAGMNRGAARANEWLLPPISMGKTWKIVGVIRFDSDGRWRPETESESKRESMHDPPPHRQTRSHQGRRSRSAPLPRRRQVAHTSPPPRTRRRFAHTHTRIAGRQARQRRRRPPRSQLRQHRR